MNTTSSTRSQEAAASIPPPRRLGRPTIIGMDMRAPFCVYVDGEAIAEHASAAQAETLYQQLRNSRQSSLQHGVR